MENLPATKTSGGGTVRARLEKMESQFALALPKGIDSKQWLRVALTTINKTPKLADCTQATLCACLLDCASLGIKPDGREAYLIPYGNACTLVIGYQGLLKRARRSGEIADIHADVVCSKDEFSYAFGSNAHLDHKPNLEDRGEPIAAYSFAKLKDGSSSFEVMNKAEIEKVRASSKAGKSGPWVQFWSEMARKTVFRRHAKMLPCGDEMADTYDADMDVPVEIDTTRGKPEVSEPRALSEKACEIMAEAEGLSAEEKAQAIAAENARPKASREAGVEG